MDVELLADGLHALVDLVGAGGQHLHEVFDKALGRTVAAPAEPAPTAEEIAAAQALLARVTPAAEAATVTPAA